MLSKLRSYRPSHATVVAYLALFVALGGSSYAALKIGSRQIVNNGVRSVDIRNNDVRGKDVRNNSLTGADVANGRLLARDFAAGQLPKGDPGPAGQTGPPGPGGPSFDTGLPSGKTLRGVYSIQDMAHNPNIFDTDSVTFAAALPSPPELHFVADGGVPPDECPGSVGQPDADPGHLCVYEADSTQRDAGDVAFQYGDGRDRFGFGLSVLSAGDNVNTLYQSNGGWAVTAP